MVWRRWSAIRISYLDLQTSPCLNAFQFPLSRSHIITDWYRCPHARQPASDGMQENPNHPFVSHTAEPCDSYMVLGEVVGVHIQNDMLKGGVYSTLAADPILRAGGADYFTIDEAQKFEMLRPKLD